MKNHSFKKIVFLLKNHISNEKIFIIKHHILMNIHNFNKKLYF